MASVFSASSPCAFARAVLASTSLVALASCQSAIPPYTVNVPPRLLDLRPPRSVAIVHGDVPLEGARAAIERAVPHDVTGSKKINVLVQSVDVTWHLVRHPVVLEAEKNGLGLEIALLGEVGAQGDGIHCSAGNAGVVFRVQTAPTLTPAGDLALDHLSWKPELRGKLDCGPVAIPLGDILDAIVQPLAGALAKGVEQIHVPMGGQLQSALAALRSPQSLKLGDGNDACLDLDPAQFVLSPVGGAGAEMNLRVGVDVAPRVTLGACVAGASGATTHPGSLVRVQPLKDAFDVAIDLAVPYTDLQALAAPQLVGHRFGDGDHTVTIESFEAGDASGRVLARMAIRGVLTGMLYMWGTPAITAEGDRWILTVPDLHTALESQSFATQLALVVLEFKDGGLENLLKSKLRLDVTDKITQATAALSQPRTLSSGPPTVTMTSQAVKILPGQVGSREGALVAQPIVSGKAEVSVGGR